MNLKKLTVVFAALVALTISTTAEAKHRHHHYSRGGLCDGIHRCLCGSTQANALGLPRMYNGHNLWQASEWPRAFPHTTAHAGAIGYQHGGGPTGHVFKVVQVTGTCTATVWDEKGTYERNICSRGAIFVDASGNYGSPLGVNHNAKGKRHRHQQYAQLVPETSWRDSH